MMDSITFTKVETNGINLNLAQKGPKDGELIILLHGFPEFWLGWRKQISYLAENGYRVWVPDQRGYHLSDKPNRISEYRIDELAMDVVGLIKASGESRVYLIGHDWGGLVAWRVARTFPDLLKKLIVINAPHDAVMGKYLRSNPKQLLKSWYILFFQLPWIPERYLSSRNYKLLEETLVKTSHKGTFTEEELKEYRLAWEKPKAIKSMINWYRANLFSLSDNQVPLRLERETLLVWGKKDRFLGSELAIDSIALCENGHLEWIKEASHWVHHEQSERVNQLIHQFILG